MLNPDIERKEMMKLFEKVLSMKVLQNLYSPRFAEFKELLENGDNFKKILEYFIEKVTQKVSILNKKEISFKTEGKKQSLLTSNKQNK